MDDVHDVKKQLKIWLNSPKKNKMDIKHLKLPKNAWEMPQKQYTFGVFVLQRCKYI